MKYAKYSFKLFLAIMFLILGLRANLPDVNALDNPNTITFDNQSGEPALVKLVGPTRQAVDVPKGQKRTVHVAAGEYHLLIRYGSDAREYSYSKGDPFKVHKNATQYSSISITLHKVVGGNYPIRQTTRKKFDSATIKTTKLKSKPLGGSHIGRPLRADVYHFRSRIGMAPVTSDNIQVEDQKGDKQSIKVLEGGNCAMVNFNIVPDALGSTNIHVIVNKIVGHTTLAGLMFQSDCVVNIWEDGTVEVERENIKAKDSSGIQYVSRKVILGGKESIVMVRDRTGKKQ